MRRQSRFDLKDDYRGKLRPTWRTGNTYRRYSGGAVSYIPWKSNTDHTISHTGRSPLIVYDGPQEKNRGLQLPLFCMGRRTRSFFLPCHAHRLPFPLRHVSLACSLLFFSCRPCISYLFWNLFPDIWWHLMTFDATFLKISILPEIILYIWSVKAIH